MERDKNASREVSRSHKKLLGLNYSSNSTDTKKWTEIRCILEAEPRRLVDGEREQENNNTT